MGFLSKRQRKSAISKHCQSAYHDTLMKIFPFFYDLHKLFILLFSEIVIFMINWK